jgi:hypothetical protein
MSCPEGPKGEQGRPGYVPPFVVWQERLPSGAVVWVARDVDDPVCIAQADTLLAVADALEESRSQVRAVRAELRQWQEAGAAMFWKFEDAL